MSTSSSNLEGILAIIRALFRGRAFHHQSVVHHLDPENKTLGLPLVLLTHCLGLLKDVGPLVRLLGPENLLLRVDSGFNLSCHNQGHQLLLQNRDTRGKAPGHLCQVYSQEGARELNKSLLANVGIECLDVRVEVDIQQVVVLMMSSKKNQKTLVYHEELKCSSIVAKWMTHPPLVHDLQTDCIVRVVESLNEVPDMGLEIQVLAKANVVNNAGLELGSWESGQGTESSIDSNVVGRNHIGVRVCDQFFANRQEIARGSVVFAQIQVGQSRSRLEFGLCELFVISEARGRLCFDYVCQNMREVAKLDADLEFSRISQKS